MHCFTLLNGGSLSKISFTSWMALRFEIIFTIEISMSTRFVFLIMLTAKTFALICLSNSYKSLRDICISLFFTISITSCSGFGLAIYQLISCFLNAWVFLWSFEKNAILSQFSFTTIKFVIITDLILTFRALVFQYCEITLLNYFVLKSFFFINFFVVIFFVSFNIVKQLSFWLAGFFNMSDLVWAIRIENLDLFTYLISILYFISL